MNEFLVSKSAAFVYEFLAEGKCTMSNFCATGAHHGTVKTIAKELGITSSIVRKSLGELYGVGFVVEDKIHDGVVMWKAASPSEMSDL